MKPDTTLIGQQIQAIGDKVGPLRRMMKHIEPAPKMLATAFVADDSFGECNRLRTFGPSDLIDYIGRISAHEEMELEALQHEVIRSGHIIWDQLRKAPLLDHDEIGIQIDFYMTTAKEYRVGLAFDAFKLFPGGGDHLSCVMSGLDAVLDALASAPPQSLKGRMRSYYAEGTSSIYAPSYEAMNFKSSLASSVKSIMEKRTLSSNDLDRYIIRRDLKALPQQFENRNAA